MPNLNVCTGPAFGIGSSGELVVAGSGSRTWALAGSISANNGLNTDPANGLWTAPHGCYGVIQEQTGSVSQTLTTSNWLFPATSFTFTNPSPAAKMRVKASVHARMTVNIAPASGAAVTAFAQFANQPATQRNSVTPVGNPTTTTQTGQWVSAWTTTETVVDAAATATLTHTCAAAAFSGSGTVTLTTWVIWVMFMGWLLDPTQAGGISL